MIVVTRRDVVPALAFDLPVALIASVLAFALDADGGVGAFALGAGSFFVLMLATAWLSIRGLEKGEGVAPLPEHAVIKRDADVRLAAIPRMVLWAAIVALATVALGTLAAGWFLGATLGGLLSSWLVLRWADSRGIEIFAPETPWWRPWSPKKQPWVYTRPKSSTQSAA